MLRRKIIDKLTRFKENRPDKCLIVEGARQVGKTYIVREFGRRSYSSFIELNFIENPSMINIFRGDLDAGSILSGIRLYDPDAVVVPGDTLIFLDEIQECPEAVTALKFLAADPRISVICSGSALGMGYKPKTSYPVGSVEYLRMTSLDFEEFLWAMDVEDSITEALKELVSGGRFDNKVPYAVHEKMSELLRLYLVTGGMPEVLQAYVDRRDFREVDRIQRRLYTDYINDIARYADPDKKIKAERCYKSIPLQLSKENHKFQYSVVEHRATGARFASSVDWLVNAHIAVPVYNLSKPEYPLKAYALENNFRLYPTDIGFLISAYGYDLKSLLISDEAIEKTPESVILKSAKGGIYEALAADMLYKSGREELYFYRAEKGTPEIDFLIETADGIVPLEIKAGRNGTKSLNSVLENEDIKYGVKFSSQNIGKAGKKITLPMYLLPFI